MSGFTRLGCGIWTWEPWVELDPVARILWLALYTSGEARRCVPGLWQGGIAMMSEAAHLPTEMTIKAVDVLLEREMAEFDTKARVLRLMAPAPHKPLPDVGEFPFNGNAVRGWWNKFATVPACAVRDAHVTTLRWLLDAGAYQTKSRRLSADHEAAWSETFKQVPIPAPRRRGVRRLMDEDTSTSVQPSLFGTTSSSGSPTASSKPLGTVPEGSFRAGSVGGEGSDRFSMISPCQKPFPNIQDQDQEQDLLSFSSGSGASAPSPARSPTGHAPGTGPVLRLVPPQPYTADEMIQAIATDACGLVPLAMSTKRQDALCRAIPSLTSHGVGLDDLRVLGAFLGANAQTANGWLAWIDKGDLLEAVIEARSWQERHGISPGVAATAGAE